MNTNIFTKHYTVPQEAIDVNGHINNRYYLYWMEDVACDHAAILDPDNHDTWVVSEHHVKYLMPGYLGQAIEVVTWLSSASGVRVNRSYQIKRGQDVLCEGLTTWICLDPETKKPKRIPSKTKQAVVDVNQLDDLKH